MIKVQRTCLCLSVSDNECEFLSLLISFCQRINTHTHTPLPTDRKALLRLKKLKERIQWVLFWLELNINLSLIWYWNTGSLHFTAKEDNWCIFCAVVNNIIKYFKLYNEGEPWESEGSGALRHLGRNGVDLFPLSWYRDTEEWLPCCPE